MIVKGSRLQVTHFSQQEETAPFFQKQKYNGYSEAKEQQALDDRDVIHVVGAGMF